MVELCQHLEPSEATPQNRVIYDFLDDGALFEERSDESKHKYACPECIRELTE